MRDTSPPPAFFRCSIHLHDRKSTALTDEIALIRDCVSLEMQRGGLGIHAASLLPQCLYLVLSIEENDEPEDRLRRICASFARHSTADVSWHWPSVAPLRIEQIAQAIRDTIHMPVDWGLAARAEDWPHSSMHRGQTAQRAVAA